MNTPGKTKDGRDGAEADLIDMLRRNDAQNFRLSVSCRSGKWVVEVIDLDNPAPEMTLSGEGPTFADAWHTQAPRWAEQ